MTQLLLEDMHRLHTPNAYHSINSVLEELQRYEQTRNFFHLENALLAAQLAHRSLQALNHYLSHRGLL